MASLDLVNVPGGSPAVVGHGGSEPKQELGEGSGMPVLKKAKGLPNPDAKQEQTARKSAQPRKPETSAPPSPSPTLHYSPQAPPCPPPAPATVKQQLPPPPKPSAARPPLPPPTLLKAEPVSIAPMPKANQLPMPKASQVTMPKASQVTNAEPVEPTSIMKPVATPSRAPRAVSRAVSWAMDGEQASSQATTVPGAANAEVPATQLDAESQQHFAKVEQPTKEEATAKAATPALPAPSVAPAPTSVAPAQSATPAHPAALAAPAQAATPAHPAELAAPAQAATPAHPAALVAPAQAATPADPAALPAPAHPAEAPTAPDAVAAPARAPCTAWAPSLPPAPVPHAAKQPAPKAAPKAATPSPQPALEQQFHVADQSNSIQPATTKERQSHYAAFKRQVTGEITSITVPQEFVEAWENAVATNSRSAKNKLFQLWCAAGGSWSKNFVFTWLSQTCSKKIDL